MVYITFYFLSAMFCCYAQPPPSYTYPVLVHYLPMSISIISDLCALSACRLGYNFTSYLTLDKYKKLQQPYKILRDDKETKRTYS